jgi:hypothetical protein
MEEDTVLKGNVGPQDAGSERRVGLPGAGGPESTRKEVQAKPGAGGTSQGSQEVTPDAVPADAKGIPNHPEIAPPNVDPTEGYGPGGKREKSPGDTGRDAEREARKRDERAREEADKRKREDEKKTEAKGPDPLHDESKTPRNDEARMKKPGEGTDARARDKNPAGKEPPKSWIDQRREAMKTQGKEIADTGARVIQAGDTLWDIARANLESKNKPGQKVSDGDVKREVDRIAKRNGINNPNKVSVGTRVQVR